MDKLRKKELPKIWLKGRQYFMDKRSGVFIRTKDDSDTLDFNDINPDTLIMLLMKGKPPSKLV